MGLGVRGHAVTRYFLRNAICLPLQHSRGVGYSGPPPPLKGLFQPRLAEKAKGSIPGGLGLEGLFLRNHRKSAWAVPIPRHRKSRRVAADEHTNTNITRLRDVLVPSKGPRAR